MRFGNKKRSHSFKEINAKVWLQMQRSKSLFTFKTSNSTLKHTFWLLFELATLTPQINLKSKSKINQSRVGL